MQKASIDHTIGMGYGIIDMQSSWRSGIYVQKTRTDGKRMPVGLCNCSARPVVNTKDRTHTCREERDHREHMDDNQWKVGKRYNAREK